MDPRISEPKETCAEKSLSVVQDKFMLHMQHDPVRTHHW
jgi:hypothetical protein